MVNFEALYEKLEDKEFQDAEHTGNYNYFIVPYAVREEAEVEQALASIKESLGRPTNYIDALCLDIFEEFCLFLDNKSFLSYDSYLKYLLNKEESMADGVMKSLISVAHSDEFYKYLAERILAHTEQTGDNMRRPYVFVYGIGRIYPYLRANELLTKFEGYNQVSKYKMILFYPGTQQGNSFKLFNKLEDSHAYRASILNL